jgi:hypothetical protein
VRRAAIPVLLLALLAAPALPAAEPVAGPAALDELMQLLAQRRHSHVSFTEVQQLAMLDQPLHSSGELLYDAPDRLEKRTLEPKPEDLVLDHGTLIMQRGNRHRTLLLRDYPQAAPFVESIRATLAGDRPALEQYFALQLSGTLADWTLELTPRDATLRRSVERIRISGEHDAIRTVEIRQRDGDVSLLSIGPELRP